MKRNYSKVAVIILLCIVGLGVYLRAVNLSNIKSRSLDERTYVLYADYIKDNGLKAIPKLIKNYNMNKEVWILPPASRIGYLLPAVLVMKLTHMGSVGSCVAISFVSSSASLLLLMILGLRFFNSRAVFYALAFLAVSPIDLALSRRVWLDSTIGFLGLALVYCCCELTKNARTAGWLILAVIIGTYGILVKESWLLAYILCLAWMVYAVAVRSREYHRAFLLLSVVALGVCASFLIITWAAGGLNGYLELIKNMIAGGDISKCGLKYQDGPWYRYLYGYWLTSALSVVFFAVGVLSVLFLYRRKDIPGFLTERQRNIATGMICFVILYVSFFTVSPGLMNYRWASPVLAPFYMISGIGFWYALWVVESIFKGARRYAIYLMISALLVMGAVQDYKVFEHIFMKLGALDASLRIVISP